MMTANNRPQVLILGSGIAGLSTALQMSEFADVSIVCKTDKLEGSTRYAQGGIASVWSKSDSFEDHVRDTLTAGAGLCRQNIVDICVKEGPDRVRELIDFGVKFTKPEHPEMSAEYDLHREGGHSHRRILHADDLTGFAIQKAMLSQIESRSDRIKIYEHHVAVNLITDHKMFERFRKSKRQCLGAYVLNIKTGQIIPFPAHITVLATGGAGKLYRYTSNPDEATGDGIAMAYLAGAKIANLEFVQFHPTCLYHPTAKNFLISEALRGEGAVLRNKSGEDFVGSVHQLASLAPRDIVARAIDQELKKSGDNCVYLDCSSIGAESLKSHFPNIYNTCLKFGIDITKEAIPVVPAAHYTCGGVLVDEHARSSIENLFAIGETACTGLHGANRLASNSLLEAVVFAKRASEFVKKRIEQNPFGSELTSTGLPSWDSGQAVPVEEKIDIAANWQEIRTLMWNYVGIVRSNSRLERARHRIELLKREIQTYYWKYLISKDLIELRNLITLADLTIQCASLRHESRGLHYTVDYPDTDDTTYGPGHRDTIL